MPQPNITQTQLKHTEAISKITIKSFIKTYQNKELGITEEILAVSLRNWEQLALAYTKKINEGRNNLSFVYIENDKVLGHIWGKQKDQNNFSVETLYIDTENVKQGIGGRLLTSLINKITEVNSNLKINVVVAKMNQNAIGFYEHFGFKIVDQELGKYKINNEISIDTVLLEKNI